MGKRSRIGTSSSTLADTDVINYVTSPWQSCSAPMAAPTSCLNPLVIEQSSENGPFSRGFSVESRNVVRHGYGGFLEKCFYCSGRIFVDMEVFMYR